MKRVVIIGGGFAGSTLAKDLEGRYRVCLVDNKDYFEFTPGILRTIAHPTRSRCMQVKHAEYLRMTEVVKGSVNEIHQGYVSVGRRDIPYDYLVVATGSKYKAPFKHPHMFVASRAKELSSYYPKLKKAKTVLIIGGGLVGVELAGEIAHYFPNVKITIINAKDHLLDRMPMQAGRYAQSYLGGKGAEFIFGEKILRHENRVFITDKKRRIKADIAFNCGGISPNSEVFRKRMGDKLDERGFARVDKFLRLEGNGNIFVTGDVNSIVEEKTAQNAEKHAYLVSRNIDAIERNKPLHPYDSRKGPIVISLGPHNGILVKGKFVFTGLVPAFLKWFVEKKELMKKRR